MDPNTLKSLKFALAAVAITSIPCGFLGYSLGKESGAAALSDQIDSGHNPSVSFSASARNARDTNHFDRVRSRNIQQASRIHQRFTAAMREFGHTSLSSVDFTAMFDLWETARKSNNQELESLLRSLEKENESQGSLMTTAMLANQFGSKNGAAAADYFLSLEKPQERVTGFASAMVGWMRDDPESAYRWLQQHEGNLGPELNTRDLKAMYFSLKAKADYAGTVQQAFSLTGSDQTAVLKLLAEQSAPDAQQRTKLLDSLYQQGDEKLTRRVESQIIDELTRQNPSEAMSVLAGLQISEEHREELEKKSLNLWSNAAPKGAILWQQQNLVGQKNAGDQIADTFRNWVAKDEAAATEWLRSQGNEFKTDLIFKKAGEMLQDQNPEQAAKWQSQVLDDASRQQSYRKLYHRWRLQDPEAAEAWKNSLPTADRMAL
ncbi:hypothetical protein JIN85_02645 [Luteolibacter pohnpeiensis]|uniref:Uncharacterized protein n=1 Tax=Luteolibacter pohnpeiensis TaxID=454153 RepID=A0A934S4X1_9BACT|nr:hypothetical protein [Luteolibacter pohnpeiensis]MBK1881295.1 hypothetical protein [Luteolibacter pohnpeiensis]